VILKPRIEEYQQKMQLINSFIKLQDGGQSFLEELPSEATQEESKEEDIIEIVMKQFNMKQGGTSCFNQMIRAQLPDHLQQRPLSGNIVTKQTAQDLILKAKAGV
jgi:hypothetical protein